MNENLEKRIGYNADLIRGAVPSWENAIRNPKAMFPALGSMLTDSQRVERAALDGTVIPVVLVKLVESSIRSHLTGQTEAHVMMDLVTVFPYPTPVAYVLTVIFDDVLDPFFRVHILHPVPPMTVHDRPILPGEVAVSRQRARNMLLDFCQSSRACGLIVLDAHNQVLFQRVVTVDHGFGLHNAERNSEIRQVVEFLDHFEIQRDLRDLVAVAQKFYSIFWAPIKCPDRVYRSVPPGRSAVRTEEKIFSIRLEDGRLVRRKANETLRPTSFVYDLFISHAHTDSVAAEAIREWIQRLYPTLRIRITGKDSQERFLADPKFFLVDSVSSACLLYLATKNSVNRTMVMVELSHNAHKPIITVAVGELTRQDIERVIMTNPFISLDTGLLIDLHAESGWKSLAILLARQFTLQARGEVVPVPSLPIMPDDREPSHRSVDYERDWMRISRAFVSRQSRAEAETLVAQELRELQKEGRIDAPPDHLDPEGQLLMILDVAQQSLVPTILDCFPALVNDYLVRFALEIAAQCDKGATPDPEGSARMRHIAECASQRIAIIAADRDG